MSCDWFDGRRPIIPSLLYEWIFDYEGIAKPLERLIGTIDHLLEKPGKDQCAARSQSNEEFDGQR
jgi:hypothetical protein